MYELLTLLLLGAVVALWFDALRSREAALEASREACERYGLQFLDETVAFSRVRVVRGEDGRLGVERQYTFEFSENGSTRRSGAVRVHGGRAEDVRLEPYPVR